ncbi:MAG: hypothetical protein ACP5OA_03075 [Candidatus Woesearchaeota archaeon]
MNKKIFFAVILIGLLFVMTACTKNIADVKNPDLVGKTVTVKGEVVATIKLGPISGYSLKDDTGTISISSNDLPNDGDIVKVSGVLVRDTLIGYYIKAK